MKRFPGYAPLSYKHGQAETVHRLWLGLQVWAFYKRAVAPCLLTPLLSGRANSSAFPWRAGSRPL